MNSGKLTKLNMGNFNSVVNTIATGTVASIWNNNCPFASYSNNGGIVTEINDNNIPSNSIFSVFPNPFNNNISCNFLNNVDKNAFIEATNIIGKVLFRVPLNQSNKLEISFENYLEGIYFLKFYSDKGTSTQKIMKID
jgi:hypothetical protein